MAWILFVMCDCPVRLAGLRLHGEHCQEQQLLCPCPGKLKTR